MHSSTKMKSLTLLTLASLTTAHFNLNYPAARGFDEDQLGTFPCGGQVKVSESRTLYPLSDGSIALDMGHVTANVEVLIAIGNDPGSAFNTVVRPTFGETGLGNFCITGLNFPASLNVTDGMNATIQVVTNGDPDGGLYNCADITFSSSAPAPGSCTNGTGVSAGTATVSGHANGTTNGDETSSSETPSSTTSSAAASGTGNAGSVLNAGVGGFALAGAAALAIVL